MCGNFLWRDPPCLNRLQDARCRDAQDLKAFAIVVARPIGRNDEQVNIAAFLGCAIRL